MEMNDFEKWSSSLQTKHDQMLRAMFPLQYSHNVPYNRQFCRRWVAGRQHFYETVVTKKRWLFCKILTFGYHWWKHYPGERRYVQCRICGRLPKSQWKQFAKMGGAKNAKSKK